MSVPLSRWWWTRSESRQNVRSTDVSSKKQHLRRMILSHQPTLIWTRVLMIAYRSDAVRQPLTYGCWFRIG